MVVANQKALLVAVISALCATIASTTSAVTQIIESLREVNRLKRSEIDSRKL
jgi:hypothetical protein